MTESNNGISFQLEGVRLFEFNKDEDKFDGNLNSVSLSFNPKYSAISLDDNSILCSIVVDFFQNETNFMNIDAGCVFRIKEDSWDTMIEKENNLIRIPIDFAYNMLSLTIGTIRGILFSNTTGTKFERMPLPAISIDGFLDNDVEIRIVESIDNDNNS